MQKMILLPYDRYQRLLNYQENNTDATATAEKIDQEGTANALEDIIPLCTKPKEVTSEKESSPDVEKLLPLFPKALRGRALALLTYIAPHVSWNDTLEVTLSGERIPYSNIVDLIKVQLKDYRNFSPVGLDKFEKLLKDINVPLSLFPRTRRGQEGRGIIPPPPGIPAKKRKGEPAETVKLKWLKL